MFPAWSAPRCYKETKKVVLSRLLSEVERLKLNKISFELVVVENWFEF
jgi:hypothetical protein